MNRLSAVGKGYVRNKVDLVILASEYGICQIWVCFVVSCLNINGFKI